MNADEKICPDCGRKIPADAPPGQCPHCAFALATGASDPSEDTSTDAQEAESLPSTGGRAPGSSGGSHPPSSIWWPVTRMGRWPFLLLFLALTIYTAGRIAWSYTHPRPSLKIGSDLRVAFDAFYYGLEDDHRLVAVNRTPVGSYAELKTYLSTLDGGTVEYLFERPGAPEASRKTVVWIPFRPEVQFSFTPDGDFVPATPESFPEGVIGTDERITAVQGQPVSEILAAGIAPTTLVSFKTRFTVASADDETDARELIVQRLDWRAYFSRFASGVALGILGIVGYSLRPHTRSAQVFLVFCLYLAVWWFARSIPSYNRFAVENMAYLLLQVFLFVPCILFLITFSSLRIVVRRPGRWMLGAAAAGSILLLVDALWFPGSAVYGLLAWPLFQVWAPLMLLFIIATVSVDWPLRWMGYRLRPTDRQRALVVRAGIVLGFLPLAAYTAFEVWSKQPTLYALPAELSVFLFPLVILYAIVRHNLLNVNELVREGFLYSILIAGLTVLYAALIGVVTPVLDQVIAESSRITRSLLLAGVFVVAIPLHSRARKAIDTRFNRTPDAYETLFEVVDNVSENVAPREYCQHVAERIRTATEARSVALLTNFEEFGGWLIAGASPVPRTEQTISNYQPLLDLLDEEKSVIFRDDVVENDTYASRRDEYIDVLGIVDAEVLIPLVINRRLVGALAIGDRTSQTNYTAAELRSLLRLCDNLARQLPRVWGRVGELKGRRIADVYPNFPKRIGEYAIERVIGEGGMAHVYLGRQNGDHVAIKVANRFVQSSPLLMERFHREAEAVHRITHPNVMRVLDIAWQGPEPYIVFEYFERGSLNDVRRREGPMHERRALRYIVDVAKGLQAGLAQNVIHRDIKPSNLFVDETDHVKIGDFGLALLTDLLTITPSGEIFGTVDFLGPELASGQRADWRADQYALGVTLYELLTGERPFRSDRFETILYRHVHAPVPAVRLLKKKVSDDVVDFVSTMLAKDPGDRFDSYEELIHRAEQLLSRA